MSNSTPKQQCKTCRFWRRVTTGFDPEIGHCRRHAPRPTLVRSDAVERSLGVALAQTTEPDWCGEWAAK